MAGDWCLACGKRYLTVITDTHVIKWCRECRTRIEDEWVGGAPTKVTHIESVTVTPEVKARLIEDFGLKETDFEGGGE